MATLDLGKIKLVWRGTYNNSTAYTVDDLVQYTDAGVTSAYICVANSTGNAPSTSGTAHASWNYLAKGVGIPIPLNTKTSAYVAVAADAGKVIYISTGGVTLNNGVFSQGDIVTIINNSGSNQTITRGSGLTLYFTADGTSDHRTLAGRGMATVYFNASSMGYISGSGLS
tara:strand:- start:215 stop:724 length:510 start_codon:yes stop_codon:yes gene_type:complete